jgi:hypothetical protein
VSTSGVHQSPTRLSAGANVAWTPSGLARPLPAALIGLVAIAAFVSIGPALDDAYIVYRYVFRFVGGRGLTFNDNEYVEGFTSLVWTLLVSLAAWITGLKVHVVSVVLNYATIVLTSVATDRLLRVLNVGSGMRMVAVALLATSALYFRVVYIGLEFGLYSLLLVCFFLALFSAAPGSSQPSTRAAIVAGGCAGALAGTRPESVVLAPLVCAVLLAWGRGRGRIRSVAYLSAAWAVVTGAIVLWRLLTYGEWLPNSVIAKAIELHALRDSWTVLRRGVGYVIDAYTQSPGLAMMLLTVMAGIVSAPARRLELMLLCVPLVVGHAAVVQNGGDWMPYFRFIAVLTPIYIAGFCVATAEWVGRRLRAVAASVVVVAAVHLASNARVAEMSLTPKIGSFDGWMDLYRQAGGALRDVWLRDDILVAESIGMLGYEAPDIYLHDPLGLTDRHLAHDPAARRTLYGRSNWRYSVGLDPALILLHYWPHQRTWPSFAHGYPADYAFYVIPWTRNGPKRCLYAIVRRDRAGEYGPALRQLNGRAVTYDEVRYPCEPAR